MSHAFTTAGGEAPTVALENVSLEIGVGEFVALVGPSGCGKTTLLNAIAGLLKPLSGEVSINGDIVRAPSRHTGYIFARDALMPWRTARENAEIGLELRGVGRAQRRERATATLESVGLAKYAHAYPRQLSQGMRQRVALARTLATDPDTMLLDEPFAALDAQTRIRVQAEFARVLEGSGKTVVLVTHDLAEAVLLADRVVVLAPSPGRIVCEVTVDLPRPRDVETLRFDPRYQQLHEELWLALKEAGHDHD
ncbi:ABC transporter ATP-binding protein [Dactylosporangium roseum]